MDREDLNCSFTGGRSHLKDGCSCMLVEFCQENYIPLWEISKISLRRTLRKKCPSSELFWSAFSRIRTKYGEILRISPYPVRMRENADHHNFEYGHFSRSRNDQKNESRKYISQETIYFDQLYMRSMLFQA